MFICFLITLVHGNVIPSLDLKPFNLSTPIPIEASPALFFLWPAKAVLESDVWSRTRSLAACLPKISRVGSYSRSCDLDLERRAVDILSHGDMFDQPRVTPHLTTAIFLGFIENVKIALSSWLSVTDIGNEVAKHRSRDERRMNTLFIGKYSKW